MSTICSSGKVAVVKYTHGMIVTAYAGTIEAVLGMIDCGDLGGGVSHGCDQHRAALDCVEKRIADIRASIADTNTRESTPTNDGKSEAIETCESGDPECGPVEFHDIEGVPLCRVCWEGLAIDSATEVVGD